MKFNQIYIEKKVKDHPSVEKILRRFPERPVVLIDSYQEVFNRSKQDFRAQKENPCLILAKKEGKFIHQIPENFGVGREGNYYFSHILNCPFDCKYCFLGGLYRSAHFVYFINFEDFQKEIALLSKTNSHKKLMFFSGYDGDSLAMEGVTGFLESFLPFFETLENAEIEVRTKAVNILPLLKLKAIKNTVIAYSLNPQKIIERDEAKTPPLSKRLEAIQKLISVNYKIGLRFDPMLLCNDTLSTYRDFFEEVFKTIDEAHIHSITLGTFRLPKPLYQNFYKHAPFDPRLALLDDSKKDSARYPDALERDLLSFAYEAVVKYVPCSKIFKMVDV